MTSKQTKYLVLGLVVVIVMAAASYFVGVRPQLDARAASNVERDAALAETETLNAQATDLENKEANLATAQAAYQGLASQFPPSFALADWVTMVADTATTANVTLNEISPAVPVLGDTGGDPAAAAPLDPTGTTTGAAAPSADMATSAVTLSAEGDLAGLRSFLGALSQMQRPLLIDSADLSGSEGSGSDGGSSLAVTGRTFLLKELPAPSDAGVAAPAQ